MSYLLVLQHIACEPPAAYEDELRAHGFDLARVELDRGEPLPDWRDFAGIVVLGGPMGAYEDDAFPWLAAEKALLGEEADAGHPVWGVCLGAQLLAASLGAEVRPGPKPEVGLLDVELDPAAAADPVFGGLPRRFTTLQWHADTFDLPPGAALLAGSAAYPHQAFVRDRAYGLQFHLEVPPQLAAEWAEVSAYAESLERMTRPGAMPRLIERLELRATDMLPLARRLFARWLELVARVPSGAIG